MPPKSGRVKKKMLSGNTGTQKRKADKIPDLEVKKISTESPSRERIGAKSRKGTCIRMWGKKVTEKKSDFLVGNKV